MKKVKGFTYDTEKDIDVIKYIDNQPNGSHYIWSLVRKDMQKENTDIEMLVKKYIDKYLGTQKDKEKKNINKNYIEEIINMK